MSDKLTHILKDSSAIILAYLYANTSRRDTTWNTRLVIIGPSLLFSLIEVLQVSTGRVHIKSDDVYGAFDFEPGFLSRYVLLI